MRMAEGRTTGVVPFPCKRFLCSCKNKKLSYRRENSVSAMRITMLRPPAAEFGRRRRKIYGCRKSARKKFGRPQSGCKNKLRTSNLAGMFSGTVRTCTLEFFFENFVEKGVWPGSRDPVNFYLLNANSSKTVKATDFNFDGHVCFQGESGHNPLKFFEKERGQGHVIP